MSDIGNETQDVRDERRTADRRKAERETMPANPEVMGRTEPAEAPGRVLHESGQPRTDKGMAARVDRPMDGSMEGTEFWPPMGAFSRRLEDIQSEFINDPAAAVKKAERLVEEAVDHMARSMREHVKRMHGGLEGNADTEKLRLMMRSYRAFIESMAGRRAA